jgi:hypothetical protein
MLIAKLKVRSHAGSRRRTVRLSELILALVEEHGAKGCVGRTRVQKEIYFLQQRMSIEVSYTPYYYGPYSFDVASTLESLVAEGLLQEDVSPRKSEGPFEGHSYFYKLTDDGKVLVKAWKAVNRDAYEKLRQAFVGLALNKQSIATLAVASKVHYAIAKANKKPVPKPELIQHARSLGWTVNEGECEKAIEFLIDRKLVVETRA